MDQPPPGLEFTKLRPVPIPPVFANGVQLYHDSEDRIVTIGFAFFTSFEDGEEMIEEGVEVAKVVMPTSAFEALVAQVGRLLERMQDELHEEVESENKATSQE